MARAAAGHCRARVQPPRCEVIHAGRGIKKDLSWVALQSLETTVMNVTISRPRSGTTNGENPWHALHLQRFPFPSPLEADAKQQIAHLLGDRGE